MRLLVSANQPLLKEWSMDHVAFLQENVKGLFPEVEVDPQAREALLAAAAREEEHAHLLTTSAKMADS
jgi:hypothetical protein